ncbi:MAG: Crp/Fnr family transcriptional regulator [Mucilaginibacter sp.]|nr:Crp/Fnr family transcriptional regulator [Mucilaginibacter sp.]
MYPLLKKYLSGDISITDEQFNAACNVFHLKTTKRNEVLVESGDISRYMYFVNKGCLRIFLLNTDGKESTRFLVPEGRFGTSFPSFILQEPSLAYVQSVGPSELLMINYDDFRRLTDFLPGWEKAYRNNLEQDYIDSIKRIESLITTSATERYALLMKDNSDLIKMLPTKIIADYLGISRETLSRLKKRV